MHRNKKVGKPWSRLYGPDKIGVPFGDLMGDDDALVRFMDTRRKMYDLGIAMRQGAKVKKMSKASFAKWKETVLNAPMDDDVPLRHYLT